MRLSAIDIFTGLLAVTTAIQVWAFIQSEKSFLSVKFAPIVLEAGKQIEIELMIHNSGRSEAIVEKFIANLKLNQTLPQIPNYLPNTETVIAPPVERDGTTKITFYPILERGRPATVSEDQITDLNLGKITLYIFGFIRYKDAFTPWGTTTVGFCATYNPPHGSIPTTWKTCQETSYTYVK